MAAPHSTRDLHLDPNDRPRVGDAWDGPFTPRWARWAATASLAGLGLAILTRLVRPFLSYSHPLIALTIGVLPNFGAGLALPLAGVFWVAGVARVRRWSLGTLLAGMAAITFVGLVGWEVVQLLAWGFPFDANDVVATAIGVACVLAVHRAATR